MSNAPRVLIHWPLGMLHLNFHLTSGSHWTRKSFWVLPLSYRIPRKMAISAWVARHCCMCSLWASSSLLRSLFPEMQIRNGAFLPSYCQCFGCLWTTLLCVLLLPWKKPGTRDNDYLHLPSSCLFQAVSFTSYKYIQIYEQLDLCKLISYSLSPYDL